MRDNCDIYGASVRGPLHASDGLPNQDAWRGGRLAVASYIVVCDGLGSRKHAREGSRLACAAVHKALSSRSRKESLSGAVLSQDIHAAWVSSLGSSDARDFATTCLFAEREASGRVVVGGIGDGMALVAFHDGRVEVIIGPRDTTFSNETNALSARHDPHEWVFHEYPAEASVEAAVLLTDGISDDLRTDKLPGFHAWLDREIAHLHPQQRWRRLAAELRNWPTPHHLDDKTIAVLRVNAQPRRGR